MAAPIGNKFWLERTKHGRNKKFTSETLWKGCLEYFNWVEDNPLFETKVFGTGYKAEVPKMRAMTINGLCLYLHISQNTWFDYAKQKDFSEVTTRADQIIKTQKFTGAAADLLNPNIIARDLGLRDDSKREHTGANGRPLLPENKPLTIDDAAALIAAMRGK